MAICLLGIGATAAVAAPATFNIPAGIHNTTASGTLTFSGITCTFTKQPVNVSNSSGGTPEGQLNFPMGAAPGKCSNGNPMSFNTYLRASKSGSAFSVKAINGQSSPYNPLQPGASWWVGPFESPWINGSGATPSKFTFNKTVVGPFVLTGSFSISKADGSLLLLQ